MGLLNEKIKEQVKNIFNEIKEPVKLIVFSQETECPTCADTRKLMEELSAISPNKVKLEVYDFVRDKEKVEFYKVDKIPATIIEGKKDYGIKFYGIPGGYEFSSLIHSIRLVSVGDSGLSAIIKEQLKSLRKQVHIQVFVTLTCPYCPIAVETAHKMAIESDFIKADMINATEFPHLAIKYQIFAVPKIIINETISFEGALPEDEFIKYVLQAGQ